MDDLKKDYLKFYREEKYAKLHWQVWKSLNPEYFSRWNEQNPDYGRVYYEQKVKTDPAYARRKSRQWRKNNPGYYEKYRADNLERLKKYWRAYKRKKRNEKNVSRYQSKKMTK